MQATRQRPDRPLPETCLGRAFARWLCDHLHSFRQGRGVAIAAGTTCPRRALNAAAAHVAAERFHHVARLHRSDHSCPRHDRRAADLGPLAVMGFWPVGRNWTCRRGPADPDPYGARLTRGRLSPGPASAQPSRAIPAARQSIPSPRSLPGSTVETAHPGPARSGMSTRRPNRRPG